MSGAIGALIGIIFVIIILGVVWWAIQKLLPLIPLDEPFRTIVYVLMVVVMVLIVLWIIIVLLGIAGIHVGGPFRWGSIAGRAVAGISAASAIYL